MALWCGSADAPNGWLRSRRVWASTPGGGHTRRCSGPSRPTSECLHGLLTADARTPPCCPGSYADIEDLLLTMQPFPRPVPLSVRGGRAAATSNPALVQFTHPPVLPPRSWWTSWWTVGTRRACTRKCAHHRGLLRASPSELVSDAPPIQRPTPAGYTPAPLPARCHPRRSGNDAPGCWCRRRRRARRRLCPSVGAPHRPPPVKSAADAAVRRGVGTSHALRWGSRMWSCRRWRPHRSCCRRAGVRLRPRRPLCLLFGDGEGHARCRCRRFRQQRALGAWCAW